MGIDIYHGTGPVDWKKVKSAGHSFGIVKATEGTSFRDSAMKTNLAGLKDAGMLRGLYHFMHVDLDPVQQANFFFTVANSAGFDPLKELPLVLDLEDRSGLTRLGNESAMRAAVGKFVTRLEELTSGRRIMIYGDVDYLSKLQGGYAGHPLWVANYTSDSAPHALPTGWNEYVLWQYSESGRVPGISGAVVDLDRFNPQIHGGGEAGLRQWLKEH